MHSLEGNKVSNKKLTLGWWNNKICQSQTAKSTRNQVAQVIKKHYLDILSLSEANVYREDDPSEVKIAGFETICDNLLSTGRSRSVIYISEKLQYKIRSDLMEEETPEVWLEVDMRKGKKRKSEKEWKKGKTLLIGQFYREMAQVRGKCSLPGSGEAEKRKERLIKMDIKVQ